METFGVLKRGTLAAVLALGTLTAVGVTSRVSSAFACSSGSANFNGPVSVKVNTPAYFIGSATCNGANNTGYYFFVWGDNTGSNPGGFTGSSVYFTPNHTYTKTGTYTYGACVNSTNDFKPDICSTAKTLRAPS